MLLDHERHTEKMVVEAITTIIPGTSPDHALNCYNTAKKLGQAIITSCIKGGTLGYLSGIMYDACMATHLQTHVHKVDRILDKLQSTAN